MGRLLLAAVICSAALSAGVDEDLAASAKSPYDIARFVDSHATFGWTSLWKALAIDGGEDLMLPCGSGGERDCHAELITVLDPFQIIVRLYHEGQYPHVYLRFRRDTGPDKPAPWKFAGYYGATSKYAQPYHKTTRIGTKPFLIVGEEEYEGFDWLIRVESWFDLTLTQFEPVFRFTTERAHNGTPDPMVAFQTLGVVMKIESTPVERIHIAYSTQFRLPKVAAMRSDSAVYARQGDKFNLDRALSKTPEDVLDAWYGLDVGPSSDELLSYLLPELRKIASGPRGKETEWLTSFLQECSDTPEKHALTELLATSARPK